MRAAVTRSMLGWGVVAGPFYLVFALTLALTRPGFDLSRHALSLLTLGENGWLQTLNFALTGIMVMVAGVGIWRAITGRGRVAGALVIAAGLAIALAGVFRPDPMGNFPPGSEAAFTMSGVLHLVVGLVEFVTFAVAAFLLGPVWSKVAGGVIALAFVAGAALSAGPAGVALLWLAVVTSFAWLLFASITVYRSAPSPDRG